MLKQTGGEDRPVQYNSEERLLAAGGDIYLAPFKKKEMRAGLSSAEGSRKGPALKIQIRKEFQTFMHAPPYKCCVQVPARIIDKDQTNLNRSHHSSSSVKAVSRGRP